MSPAVSIELKMDKETKSLLDRIPEDMADRLAKTEERLAEMERVLTEICDRGGIAFNVDQPKHQRRERIVRNVKAD